ncbi:membrane fusion protein, multidrug efflux system [Polynucleobacter kasalickyi]|uniref:Membrane fusion protein, multidrug efflux system n=2 Tax=Polynucleobacter kasalickyi TaxID=1938817 RepID=A0A1W1Y2D1_9BURK|nr:membrane fusion protein, multidrug efflux system [Polynucleobacter kasalickyi]
MIMNMTTPPTDSSSNKLSKSPMRKRMIIMLASVGILMGLIIAFNVFKGIMIKKYIAGAGIPPQTVTSIQAESLLWQPQLTTVGNVRAFRGVELGTEVTGLVKEVFVKSGQEVKKGDLLIELSQDADRAQLQALQAQAELARVISERDKAQLAINAISKNAYDSSQADYKAKLAQVAQQTALVEKKNLRAPFSGKVGIVSINPGQYINTGEKLFTIQTVDPVYIDFTMAQTTSENIKVGQVVHVKAEGINQDFSGKITAISPKVDSNSRNIQIEALVTNANKKLLPGMFTNVKIESGEKVKYITIPNTSIAYNPYGAMVYVVKRAEEPTSDSAKDKGTADSAPKLVAQQILVTTGPTRGDQVAILTGLAVGDEVVTSGQLKLNTGTPLIINNSVIPANNINPTPQEK